MKIQSFLKNVFLFSELSEQELNSISAVSVAKRLKKNQALFMEDDPADNFYVIVHGAVKVFRLSEKGTEQVLHIHGNGELVAEAAVFGMKKYPASCSALKETLAVKIPKAQFVEIILKQPKLSLKFMLAYSKRLKEFVEQIEILSSSVEDRLKKYLKENSTAGSNGRRVCVLNISKKELAGALGTVPETLSRMLKQMGKKGFISMRGKEIILRK